VIRSLRHLLIQRAARLQERPALTAPGWGTLSYFQFRNRVEGIALGLMALEPPPAALSARTGAAWDWASEVAAACCGIGWDPGAPAVDASLLGGADFNDERGRQAYHDREEALGERTPLGPGLDHGLLLARLQRLNGRLGWDHETRLLLPLAALPAPEGRAALWSALYAGAHAELLEAGTWDPEPFRNLLSAQILRIGS
jgi:hypothetical protein